MVFICLNCINYNIVQASSNNKNKDYTNDNVNKFVMDSYYQNKEIFPTTDDKIGKQVTITYSDNEATKTLTTNEFQIKRYPTLRSINDCNIQQNQSIYDYLKTLTDICEDVKLVNTDINNKKFSNILVQYNYLMPGELFLIFSYLVDKTINEMLNNNVVKNYKLQDQINEFQDKYIQYCGENEMLDTILGNLKKSYIQCITPYNPKSNISINTKHYKIKTKNKFNNIKNKTKKASYNSINIKHIDINQQAFYPKNFKK